MRRRTLVCLLGVVYTADSQQCDGHQVFYPVKPGKFAKVVCVVDPTQTRVDQAPHPIIAAQCCEPQIPHRCRRYLGESMNDSTCMVGNSIQRRGSIKETTFEQAEALCSSLNLEMCRTSCSATGCGYNNHPVWTSIPCNTCANRSSVKPSLVAIDWKPVMHSETEETFSRMCHRNPLKKTTVSDERRYIGVVGMEHTGHHLWVDVFASMSKQSTLSDSQLVTGARLSAQFWQSFVMAGALPCGNRTQHQLQSLHNAWRDDAETALQHGSKPMNRPKIVPLPMPSFPTSRRIWNPDYTVLAEAAELAKVDLRFIVLTRPPQEILYVEEHALNETSVRPAFSNGQPMMFMNVLTASCLRLVAQLSVLDGWYICFPYERRAYELKMQYPETSRFLGRNFSSAINKVFQPSRRAIGAWARLHAAHAAVRQSFHALRDCSLVLESLCRKNDAVYNAMFSN